MILSAREIARITGAELAGAADNTIRDLLIDSRKVSELSNEAMFIALEGQKNDGHKYIDEMYDAGVRVFIVARHKYTGNFIARYRDASFIIAENSLLALQKLAAWKRNQYNGIVIAITGSNGKTVVKEWLSQVLGRCKSVIRSPRSYNSQVGVPLSLWNLDNDYDIAIIEAGMSLPGEISILEKMIKPEMGIFTHIGEAHQENFDSLEKKIEEKLSLFINSNLIIFPYDKTDLRFSVKEDSRLNKPELFSWSASDKSASVLISADQQGKERSVLNVSFEDREFKCEIPFSDLASVENISTVISCLICLGIDRKTITEGVAGLHPVAMRMEQKEGINNCLILEDYYNSDPGSLLIAIEYLKGITDKNMTVILSDFIQSSSDKDQLYGKVAENMKKAGVQKLIGIGKDLFKYRDYFKLKEQSFYSGTDDFIESWSPALYINEAILLKGARKYQFERISRLFELNTHQTKLEINLNAVLDNLNTYRKYLGSKVKMMAMVKAFAYGAGPREISEWLVYNNIDYLAVAYPDEGVNLRNAGINKRIMVMNPDQHSMRIMIDNDLEPEIYDRYILESFISETRKNGIKGYPVHIKLDTGMHRLGFMEEDMNFLLETLNTSDSIKIASVFTHLAAAYDEKLDSFTHKQAELFINQCNRIQESTGAGFLRHMLNSAGIIRFPQYQFDMVRLGIGLYGISEVCIEGLRNVLSFNTRISQIKNVKAGEGLGYGLTDKAGKNRKIAIIPVGYADGLRRQLGQGRGKVFANDKQMPIIGNICMDMCMIDISGTDLKIGDKVEIFGDNIPVNEVADLCDTIPYEILTGIPSRVRRVFLYE